MTTTLRVLLIDGRERVYHNAWIAPRHQDGLDPQDGGWLRIRQCADSQGDTPLLAAFRLEMIMGWEVVSSTRARVTRLGSSP